MDINRNNVFFDKLKQNVTDSFDRLRKAVDMREKLLLRQLSVVVQQSQHITFEYDRIRFLGDGEDELVGRIRTYGRYNIDNFNVILQKEPYENEDYILPSNDHDLMHKSCRQGADDERDPESEEIVVEFFNNRSLIKDSAEMLRESIINLTLNESREIIDRTIGCKAEGLSGVGMMERKEVDAKESTRSCKIDPTTHRLSRGRSSVSDIPLDSLSLQGLQHQSLSLVHDDGCNNNNVVGSVTYGNLKNARSLSRDGGEKMVSLSLAPQRMIPKASQTDGLITVRPTSDSEGNVRKTEPTEKSVKNVGHLTMNSCGSTINLKNVTNLTINACSERATVTPVKKLDCSSKADGSDGFGGEPEKTCPSEQGSPECGFYKRLITENKLLRNHVLKSMLGGNDSKYAAKHTKPTATSSASDHSGSTTSKNTVTESNQVSPESDDSPSSLTSVPDEQTGEEGKDAYLKISLSDKELQHMLDMPSSLHDKSLSFVLGELYGLTSSANGSGAGPGHTGAGGESNEHSNQIQQWLKQIISESEIEPFQNAEMLEFSKIHN